MFTTLDTPDNNPFTIIVDSKGVAVRPIDLMLAAAPKHIIRTGHFQANPSDCCHN
jgi:hypothetical protein